MEKGKSAITNTILNFSGISEDSREVDFFINNALSKEYIRFNESLDAKQLFQEKNQEFTSRLSEEDFLNLRLYTGGYEFKNVNAILRNTWNYETNGTLNEEVRQRYKCLANNINLVSYKSPSYDTNFVTYRGVTIDAFKQYGIQSIEELGYMKGNFMYDAGFTSTSVIRDTSFFGRNINSASYNIEIQYLISDSSHDGIFLDNQYISVYSSENEFLIRNSSLSKVLDVQIDSTNNTAKVICLLIPEKVWNKRDYNYHFELANQNNNQK